MNCDHCKGTIRRIDGACWSLSKPGFGFFTLCSLTCLLDFVATLGRR